MSSYNHSRHRGIGMKPADVNRENESVVWQRLYGDKTSKPIKYKFKVGDEVRICKARRTFKKGYLPSWAELVFTVTKRVPRSDLCARLLIIMEKNWRVRFTSRNCRSL